MDKSVDSGSNGGVNLDGLGGGVNNTADAESGSSENQMAALSACSVENGVSSGKEGSVSEDLHDSD